MNIVVPRERKPPDAAFGPLRFSFRRRGSEDDLGKRAPPDDEEEEEEEEDGGIGDALDSAASAMSEQEVAKPWRLLWRAGWASWWGQTILNVISAVVLAFARSTRAPTDGALFSGLLFSALGTGCGFISMGWTWGYTRLANREAVDDAFVRKARAAFKLGAALSVAGMALSLVSAQQVVGTLIAKSLLAPGVLGAIAGSSAGAAAGTTTVTALDIFVVQANTNTLCAHLVGLTTSLGLLLRSENWQVVATPPAAPKKKKKAPNQNNQGSSK